MDMLMTPEFWIGLTKIIWINIILSGDNAVVIALAARSLPPHQQRTAVFWGSGAAVVMRIALTVVAVQLLALPYLQIVGGALLLWIGVQLLGDEDDGGEGEAKEHGSLMAAVRTILIADLVMSLDNVIAVAAAAKGSNTLLILGLAISIPLVIFASRLLLVLMERYPVIITLGAALLGWVAGDMAVTDPIDEPWVDLNAAFLHWGAPLAGAVGVVLVGKWLSARKAKARAARSAAEAPLAVAVPGGHPGGHPSSHPSGHLRSLVVAVDGSAGAEHAVNRVLALRDDLREGAALSVHVLNVQRPVSGDVSRFVPGQTLEDYHRERGDIALVPARALLDGAGLAHQVHLRVGDPGPTIAEFARQQDCDLIVMGARGLGSNTAALLGSVTQSTIEHAAVPVLVVK